MDIFVLIPAFDEKDNLPGLIQELEGQFKKLRLSFKIFFVIQGTDGSKALLETLKKTKKFIDFIYFPKPLGIGNAYRIGYKQIEKSARMVLTMDADLNHSAADIPKLLNTLVESKSDLVIGSRFVDGGEFGDKRTWKRIASVIMNKIVTGILRLPTRDISSGFRLMKKEVAEKVSKKLKYQGYPAYMEFILLTREEKFKISETPITYHPRIWGKSKIGSIRTVLDYYRFLTNVILK